MCIKMTDLDTLQDFHEAVGFVGNLSGLQKHPSSLEHHKPTAEWKTYAMDVIFEVAVRFYPYLGRRRQQKVKDFMAWYGCK